MVSQREICVIAAGIVVQRIKKRNVLLSRIVFRKLIQAMLCVIESFVPVFRQKPEQNTMYLRKNKLGFF